VDVLSPSSRISDSSLKYVPAVFPCPPPIYIIHNLSIVSHSKLHNHICQYSTAKRIKKRMWRKFILVPKNATRVMFESVCDRPYGTERLREHLHGASAHSIPVSNGCDPCIQVVFIVILLLIRRPRLTIRKLRLTDLFIKYCSPT
jgi:hypothetical protein